MDKNYYIELLIRNREIFVNLLVGTPQEAYLWKPSPDKWCLLEVLCHLVDEEREDFRARLRKILEEPASPFEPIDPEGWVTERSYIAQDWDKKIREFLNERDKSIFWLQSLSSPNWDNVSVHPKAGSISAKKMLASWIAHDYLHFRQITRLKYFYLQDSTGVDLSYAGRW